MNEGTGLSEGSHLYSLAACEGHDNANWSSCFILKVAGHKPFCIGTCFLAGVQCLQVRLLAVRELLFANLKLNYLFG